MLSEEDDPSDMFSEFRFRSFRKDRQIHQDYALLDPEDPESLANISTSTMFTDLHLNREAIELVEIEEKSLIDHEKQ